MEEQQYYFEVLTRTGIGQHATYNNEWTEEVVINGKTERHKMTFPTHDAAKQELDEHIADLKEADMEYEPGDFRIKRRKLRQRNVG